MGNQFEQKYSRAQILEVYRLWSIHCKTRDIAKRIGCSDGYVNQIITRGKVNGEIEERRIVNAEK